MTEQRRSQPMNDAEIEAVTVGEAERHPELQVVDYNPDWPRLFEREAARIRAALGEDALSIEHVGSTSVSGLAAKPVIDINLAVRDSANEASYVPRLGAAGYRLRILEHEWFQHRMFKGQDPEVNLHVFSAGCTELAHMRRFRDWLRRSPEDRARYADAKRRLVQRDWTYVQNYADAKAEVVAAIMARARSWADHLGDCC